jgi:hypothetical protein
VELEPGERKKVHVSIDVDDLKFYDETQKTWALDPEYKIYVGNSSDRAEVVGNIRLSE